MNSPATSDAESIRKRCLVHAASLLRAAQAILSDTPHIAFHLALVALEEIGKGEMQWLKQPPGSVAIVDSSAWVDSHADDHETKIFWAIWLYRFLDPQHLVQSIRDDRDTARSLHAKRLDALYVSIDPSKPTPDAVVTLDAASGFLELVAARLATAEAATPREMRDEDVVALTWFVTSIEDRERRRQIFGSASLAKLKELGEMAPWIRWLKSEFEAAEAAGREQLARELARERPEGEEAGKDKWRFRLRLVSASHRTSSKVLKEWNRGVLWMKLFPVDKHPTWLDVDLLGPSGILATNVWGYGWETSRLFVVTLNMGTFGFWWWYLPTHIRHFYSTLQDLESGDQLIIERSPRLEVDWKGGPLTALHMRHVQKVFLLLVRMADVDRTEFIEHYFRGLALMAKNDIFQQLEPNVFECFYAALKCGMRIYGLWDGSSDYRTAWDGGVSWALKDEQERGAYFESGESMLRHTPPAMPITLEQVGVMKILVDGFMLARPDELIRKPSAPEDADAPESGPAS